MRGTSLSNEAVDWMETGHGLPETECMGLEEPFPDAIHGPELDRLIGNDGIVFLMAIRVTIKSLLLRRIKRKPPLLALVGHPHSRGCRLGCVMHRLLYKDV